MPMAQALVMVRTKVEHELAEPGLLSPMRGPLGPQLDTSLITSTVRKRKTEPPPDADDESKRGRVDAAEPLRRVSYGLAQTGPLLANEQQQQQRGEPAAQCDAHAGTHPSEQQQHQQQQHHPQQQQGKPGSLLGTLFSPVFHLLHKDGGEGGSGDTPSAPGLATPAPTLCPAAPCQHTGGSELRGVGAAEACVEIAAPPRPHTPPPEALASCEAAPLSPLASPKAAAAAAAALQPGEEDAGPAVAAAAQPAAPVEAGEESEEEYDLEFDPLLFIKRLPPLEQCVPVRRTSFLLPRQTRRSKRKTLVLDLDETLVHSTLDNGFCRPDFTFPVEVGSIKHMVSVRQRPHLHTFLERVARVFEVVVFTASQRVYAEQLLNVIDPRRTLIRHRVYRESCVLWEGNYLKDLTVLGRDLRDTVIVDNSPQAFGFQLDNGIPIESWYDDDCDEELLRLLPFLEHLALADDVRPAIAQQFKLRALVDATPDPPQRRCLGVMFGGC